MIRTLLLCGALLTSPLMENEQVVETHTTEVFETIIYKNGEDTLSLITETECIYTKGGESKSGTYVIEDNVITCTFEDKEYKFDIDNETLTFVDHTLNWNEVKDTITSWFEDTDNNGTPDIIDKIKNATIIGSITIGALATFLISALSSYVSYLLQKRKYKQAMESSVNANKTSETCLKAVEEVKERMDKVEIEMNNILANFNLQAQKILDKGGNNSTELQNEIRKAINEINKYKEELAKYDITNEKIDALLENQLKIASNDNGMIASGVAKELKEVIDKIKGE